MLLKVSRFFSVLIQHEMLLWMTVTFVDVTLAVLIAFVRRRWWGCSWWSASWPLASCSGWLRIVHLHDGSSAMAGIVQVAAEIHFILALCVKRWLKILSFIQVCSGSNIRQKGSCVHWPESRCPNRTGETGGSYDAGTNVHKKHSEPERAEEFQPM